MKGGKFGDRRVLVQGFHRGLLGGAVVSCMNSTSGRQHDSVASFIHLGREDREAGNWHYEVITEGALRALAAKAARRPERVTSSEMRELQRDAIQRLRS